MYTTCTNLNSAVLSPVGTVLRMNWTTSRIIVISGSLCCSLMVQLRLANILAFAVNQIDSILLASIIQERRRETWQRIPRLKIKTKIEPLMGKFFSTRTEKYSNPCCCSCTKFREIVLRWKYFTNIVSENTKFREIFRLNGWFNSLHNYNVCEDSSKTCHDENAETFLF